MSVFISYAREDRAYAARLANLLHSEDVAYWLDIHSLKPGQDWKREIKLAIRQAKLIVLLISSNSVTKRGFVQNEIKEAIEQLRSIPAGEVFIIPVRINNCEPLDLELGDLNWFDLEPNVTANLAALVSQIRLNLESDGGVSRGQSNNYTGVSIEEAIQRKTIIPVDVQNPFSSKQEFFRMIFGQFPATHYGDSFIAWYIQFQSKAEGVVAPTSLIERFPEIITIVIQNQYRDLSVDAEGMAVTMWFHGEPHSIFVPWHAFNALWVPQFPLWIDCSASPEQRVMNELGLKRKIAELEAELEVAKSEAKGRNPSFFSKFFDRKNR